MAEHQTSSTDARDLKSKGSTEHVDRLLDQAIEDSFPTSDPVSLAMPHERAEHRPARALLAAGWLPVLAVGGIAVALWLRRRAR